MPVVRRRPLIEFANRTYLLSVHERTQQSVLQLTSKRIIENFA